MRVELLTPTLSTAVLAEARATLSSGPYTGVLDDLQIDLTADRPPNAAAVVRAGKGAPIDALATLVEPSAPGAPWALTVLTNEAVDPALVSIAYGAMEAFLPKRSPIEWWARGNAATTVRPVAVRHGFALSRTIDVMRGQLSSVVEVLPKSRAFTLGDSERVVSINNAAFADHGDRAAWTVDTLHGELHRFGDRFEDLRVAPCEGEPMGFCWTRTVDDRTGEIFVLATHPEARGTGLGGRLLTAGLDHIRHELERSEAILYVDAENSHAIALYERNGFVNTQQSLVAFTRLPLY